MTMDVRQAQCTRKTVNYATR
eukprot:COSAG06_NODE_43925_length_367_cov_6.216418_2_plen_20_part_01